MKLHIDLKRGNKSSFLYAVAVGTIFTFNQAVYASEQDFTLQGMPPEIKEKIIGMTGNDDMQEMKKWGEVSRDFNETYKRALSGHAITINADQLNDNTVETLKHIDKLEVRILHATDETMRLIGKLTKIKNLYLGGAYITAAGLVHLNGLSNLQNLNLGFNEIKDAELVNLQGLSNLKMLTLVNTGITGVGFVHLKSLSNLQVLNLSRTKVTDAGLVNLKSLNLHTLDLSRTKVTDAGVKELKKSIPNLTVFQ